MSETIRVILADDHPVVRSGIRMALESDEIQVVAEASNGHDAQSLCLQHHPHLILLDLQMPGPSAAETINYLHEHCPATKILMLTAHTEDSMIRAVMRAGVAGYLLKEEATDTLVRAVWAIYKGAAWYSQSIANRFVAWQFGREVEVAEAQLTRREHQLLTLIARGWDNATIAQELGLSRQTIRNYTSTIYEKLNVHSRAEAIVWARERGFIDEQSLRLV